MRKEGRVTLKHVLTTDVEDQTLSNWRQVATVGKACVVRRLCALEKRILLRDGDNHQCCHGERLVANNNMF